MPICHQNGNKRGLYLIFSIECINFYEMTGLIKTVWDIIQASSGIREGIIP
jgi:hypothetical protein